MAWVTARVTRCIMAMVIIVVQMSSLLNRLTRIAQDQVNLGLALLEAVDDNLSSHHNREYQ